MFNLGRFGRCRFNVRAGGEDGLRVAVDWVGSVKAMIGGGENIHEAVYAQEAFGQRGMGAAGEIEAQDLAAEVGAEAAAYASFVLEVALAAAWNGRATGTVTAWLACGMDAMVDAVAFFGRELYVRGAWDGAVDGVAAGSRDVPVGTVLADVMMGAAVSSRRMSVEEAVLAVSVTPGGVLVVDAGAYTVTLNGQDAIDRQRGVWPWVDRECGGCSRGGGVGEGGGFEGDAGVPSEVAVR